MNSVRPLFLLLIAFGHLCCACSKKQPDRKETFPVSGEVYVDGKPGGTIKVDLHDVKGVDTKQPTYSSAFTDDNGKFVVSTYEQGDGAPEGEYAVTFVWGQLNLMSMQYGGPDKLKGKYSDPAKSQFRVTVKKGQTANIGRVDLKTN